MTGRPHAARLIMAKDWTIEGAEGEPIIGNAHRPRGDARGVVLIAHGFKGYKDYGMFPRIAEHAAAEGFVAHRFNFSHSGMTNAIETFARPDLFEKDTWNKQVFDFGAVIGAVSSGTLDGQGLPYVMFGHSRGGVAALLAAGRFADDASVVQPAGIVSASAPASCRAMTGQQAEALLAEGYVVSPSSRTGQDLRIGKVFLTEQIEDPQGHDLSRLVGRIKCPVLLVHGENDPTVPAACARQLAGAIGPGTAVAIIPAADHVYKTPNPMPPDARPSPQLGQLLDALAEFARKCCNNRG